MEESIYPIRDILKEIKDIKDERHKIMLAIGAYEKEATVKLFKDNELIWDSLNRCQASSIRVLIAKGHIKGNYYFMWNSLKIEIDENGSIIPCPKGLWDQDYQLIKELLT